MAKPARPKATLTKFKAAKSATGKFIAGVGDQAPPETCETCQRWDRFTETSQVPGEPARGICCGAPPQVFHTPTPDNPHATVSANPVTTSGRPACHLYVLRR